MLAVEPKIKLLGRNWNHTGCSSEKVKTYMRGSAFKAGLQKTAIDLNGFLPDCGADSAEWADALDGLNGFFAIVRLEFGRLIAAVDRVRSVPLFYGRKDGSVYLSDDAEWIRKQVGDTDMDPLAREEFLLAGYVTGEETLYKNVRQLQAGELLIAELGVPRFGLLAHRYYLFSHTEPDAIDELALREEFNFTIEAAMRRLIAYAGDRMVVVPLSGGYDSRLITTWLKKLDYRNVLTFSYGLVGNREAAQSRAVAEALGFVWHFVEYSNDLWAEEWASAEAKRFREMASGHCSLPHIQDWLAIKRMHERGVISSDCIVVPGHTGDFVAGGHIPDCVFSTKSDFAKADLIGAIQRRHLANCPIRTSHSQLWPALSERVGSRIHVPYQGDRVTFAAAFEQWDWQERQAKYIVNSVRVYDVFGLNWWMPLWDTEFLKFWERVPLELRRERKWYISLVTDTFQSQIKPNLNSGVVGNFSDEVSHNKVFKIARRFIHALPRDIGTPLRGVYGRYTLDKHFLAFGGLVDKRLLLGYLTRGYNIIGIYSDLFLRGDWGKDRTTEKSEGI